MEDELFALGNEILGEDEGEWRKIVEGRGDHKMEAKRSKGKK